MKRGCFRVSPLGTDVMGLAAGEGLPVCRCVSAADTSLSLSLSLCSGSSGLKPDFGVRRGARQHLLAGSHRAPGRGVHRSRAGRAMARCVNGHRVLLAGGHRFSPVVSFPGLGRSLDSPWRTVMGITALAPSRAWFPGRRGSQARCGAHPFSNPKDCWPISDRSHKSTTIKETR